MQPGLLGLWEQVREAMCVSIVVGSNQSPVLHTHHRKIAHMCACLYSQLAKINHLSCTHIIARYHTCVHAYTASWFKLHSSTYPVLCVAHVSSPLVHRAAHFSLPHTFMPSNPPQDFACLFLQGHIVDKGRGKSEVQASQGVFNPIL